MSMQCDTCELMAPCPNCEPEIDRRDRGGARIATLTRALRDLVGALPTCDNCCGSPATTEQFNPLHESEGVFCDECDRNAKPWGRGDLEHARALRAALRELKEPEHD